MPRASFSNGFPPDAPCLDAPHPPVGCRFAFIREARGGWAGGQHPGGWTGAPEGGMPRASFANGFPPDASCLEAPHPSCGTQIMTLIREARGGWAGGQHPGGWTGAPEGGMPRASFANGFPPDASCLEAPHPSCGTQIMTLIREACGGWAGGQPPGGWTGAPEGGTPPHQIIQRFPTRRLVPGRPPSPCEAQIITVIREAYGGWTGGQPPGGWTGAPEDGMPRASFSNGFPFDASCLDAPPPL